MIRNCLFLFVLVIITSCSKGNKEQLLLKYDTTKIAILDADKLEDFKKYKSVKLSNEDLLEIEELLRSSVLNYNSAQIKLIPNYQIKYPDRIVSSENVTINLDKYRRQYIAYINEKEQKIVFVYCMVENRVHKEWKKELLYLSGGGDGCFQVAVNLSSKKQEKISINDPG